MNIPVVALTLLAAYVLGSIPFGFLIAKSKGIDIRKLGSGNIGATNVFRMVGKGPGIAVFFLDALKGFLAVFIAEVVANPGMDRGALMVLAGFIAILGHNYTFWLGFKGGKGIATSAGVLIGLAPFAVLIVFGVWVLIFLSTRYVALASIGAAAALPVTVFFIQYFSQTSEPWILGFAILTGLLAILRHHSNIQRLRAGTESKMLSKKQEEKQ